DQPVRQHGIGGAPDARELEFDAGFAARLGDCLVDLAWPVATAELSPHVVVACHAFRGHVGVELERPPRNRPVIAASVVHSSLEATHVYLTPRTHVIENDYNIDHATTSPFTRKCRKTPARAAIPSAMLVVHAAAGQPPRDTRAAVIGGPTSAPKFDTCMRRPVAAPTSSRRGACTGVAGNRQAGATPRPAPKKPGRDRGKG